MILGLLAAEGSDRPWLHQNNPAIWEGSLNPTWGSAAGEKVTPQSAMSLAAYFACVRVIGEDTSKLPIRINKKIDDRRSEPVVGIRELYLLNEQANENATSMTVREHIASQCASRGNGFAELQWGGNGKLHAIHSLVSDRMKLLLVRKSITSTVVEYWYMNDWGDRVQIQAEDILHVVGPSENGLIGMSVCQYANEAIGTGLAQQKFSGSFYGNGAMPGGVLEHPAKLSQEAQDRLRKNWEKNHAAAKGKANKIGVLEEGMTYHEIGVTPKDAEMILSRRFSIEEIARWFRMPLGKIQHNVNAKGWATTEQENQIYLTDTLQPWIERITKEINRKLFPNNDHFVIHETDALLRADADSRSSYYQRMQQIGVYTINEIRDIEGLESIGPDGDVRFVQANLQTLERAQSDNPKLTAPEDDDPSWTKPAVDDEDEPEDAEEVDEEEDDEESAEALIEAMTPWVKQSAKRIMRKEQKAMERIIAKAANDQDQLRGECRKLMDAICSEMIEAFAPAIGKQNSLLNALCATFTDGAVEEYCGGDAEGVRKQREALAANEWVDQILILVGSVNKHARDE